MAKAIKFKPTHTPKGWRINVPASVTGTTRKREFFPTREKANARAAELRERFAEHGSQAIQLTQRQQTDADVALEILDGRGTLTDAARCFVQHLERERKSVTFEELTNDYRETRPLSKDADTTYRLLSARFGKYFDGLKTFEVTPKNIDDALAAEGLSPATRNTYLRRFTTLFRFGIKRGYHEKNPADLLDPLPIERRVPDVLTPEQARTFLEAAQTLEGGDALAYIVLCLLCGIRSGEAHRVKWDDVKLEGDNPTVYLQYTKTGVDRYVDLEPNAVAWLSLIKNREGYCSKLTKHQRIWRLRKLRKIAGITDWQNHTLRHTACSYYWAYHKDEGALTNWAGHTIQINLKHYRRAITREDAVRFWSIFPGGVEVPALRSIA